MTNGGDRRSEGFSDYQNDNLKKPRTVDKIAKEHGVGAVTVSRAEKFAKGVDEAEATAPGSPFCTIRGFFVIDG